MFRAGIDLGGTNIKAGIVDENQKILAEGSVGTVDAQSGVVLYSNNFDWNNVPLVAELKKYFHCPVSISNDANCAALGEVKAGAAKEVKAGAAKEVVEHYKRIYPQVDAGK